ncbi:MAG: ABC transporter ATP-binding protein [Gammaproteobacteria bacterium]
MTAILPESTTPTPAVDLEAVSKSYRRGDEIVHVLDHFSFTVASGDFIALMAPSGSGKSTLLNLIGGLDHPDQGRIRVAGTELAGLRESALTRWRSRNIGFIFQLYYLIPVLSAARNVELPLLLQPLSRAERAKRVEAALTLTGLPNERHHFRPPELSGGQQQRVAIARAIVTDPPLLLCDEPTGDLDRAAGNEILELLKTLNERLHKTILMVTHDPHAAELAHRVVHLEKGLVGELRAA